MTRQPDCTLSDDVMRMIAEQGLDAMPELIRIINNATMQAERQQYLRAGPYERTTERRGYANGFKPKTVTSCVGDITFAVPQVREAASIPARSNAVCVVNVQGVSTRKVVAITEQLCGVQLDSMQVSRAAQQLDEQLAHWRTRRLGKTRYLYLDARYEKVRIDGQVRDAAVLLAMGVLDDGKRALLGVSVAVSEQEVHWRQFLQELVERGLSGVELVISDAHTGLQAARKAVFGGVPWQRCQFHLQQNAQAFVPRHEIKSEVAAAIRAVFNAPNRAAADALLTQTVQTYATTPPSCSLVGIQHPRRPDRVRLSQ